jgi:uncharacterized membrane protein
MAVPRLVSAVLSVALIGVLAVYPLFVYFGIGRFGVAPMAGVLAGACFLRLLALRLRGARQFATRELMLLSVGGMLLAGTSLWFDSGEAVLYYPVLVNAALFGIFAGSLANPPTLVERLARLRDPELSPAAIVYTRRVTIAWAVFFVVNGSIALYTALATPLATWAWYNGFIAYLLIGTMFGAELLVRSVVMKKQGR